MHACATSRPAVEGGHGHACTTHYSSDISHRSDDLIRRIRRASAVVSLSFSIRVGNLFMHAVARKSDRRCFISWPDFTRGSMAVPGRRLRFARASCHRILSLADSRRGSSLLVALLAWLGWKQIFSSRLDAEVIRASYFR
jgi:hypothetical protein